MMRVIAIDGPAASGKSSTAAAVAKRLGGIHLDSGALYRGVTRVAIDAGTFDPDKILEAVARRSLELREVGDEIVPFLEGQPAEASIRAADVTAAVSRIAAIPSLRDWVNHRLREVVKDGRIYVLDGRDIGSVVFPDACLKVFLTASPNARAARRLAQRGEMVDPNAIDAESQRLAARDRLDSSRAIAPLRPAQEAVVIDTTDVSFDGQVALIVQEARRALYPSH